MRIASLLAIAALAAACTAEQPTTTEAPAPVIESTLEVINVATGERRVVLTSTDEIGAPNWVGAELVFNSGGLLYAVPVAGGERRHIATGDQTRVVHDHAPSPDGTQIAFSAYDADDPATRVAHIFIIPIAGGDARQVTNATGPSYFHDWSADGRTLAFTGRRAEDNYDVYTIGVDGGAETRLTTAEGTDDGADYAPDGTIYFNSARSGKMQIWRMRADGSNQTQVTTDVAFNDWFPHPSPDGRLLAFTSYDGATEGLQSNAPVSIRVMPLDGSAPPRVLAAINGGQGSMNANSWSPDSTALAFVSHRVIEP